MQGDKLVPKKIRESLSGEPVKRALAEIWQYEINRADKSRGPYKDQYRASISRGSRTGEEPDAD